MNACLVCGSVHYNACANLWGGEPERPESYVVEASS